MEIFTSLPIDFITTLLEINLQIMNDAKSFKAGL